MSVLTRPSQAALASPRASAVIGVATAVAAVAVLVLVRGPVASLWVVLIGVVLAALVLNVQLAAMTFVAAAPFEGYLKSISGAGVKALGAVLFLAWVVALLRSGRPVLGRPVVVCAAALFTVLLASTVLHDNGALGIEVATRYVSFLAAFLVLFDCMSRGLPVRRVALVYVAASTVAAVGGLSAFFRGSLRAGGPVGDPNDFAFFLLVALALCLGLRRDDRRRRYDIAAIVLLVAIFATLSRGALVGLAAMLLVAAATRRINWRVIAGAGGVLFLSVACVFVVDPGQLSTSLHAKGVVAQQNVDERLTRWTAAAEMTFDHPVLGLGPAGFRENYDRYVDYQTTNVTHRLDVAHEMYLEVSSELGVLGLAAFLGIIVLGARTAVRAGRGGPDAGLATSVWLATVGAAVAALFLTEQYYLPVWLLAAMGAALGNRPDRVGG